MINFNQDLEGLIWTEGTLLQQPAPGEEHGMVAAVGNKVYLFNEKGDKYILHDFEIDNKVLRTNDKVSSITADNEFIYAAFGTKVHMMMADREALRLTEKKNCSRHVKSIIAKDATLYDSVTISEPFLSEGRSSRILGISILEGSPICLMEGGEVRRAPLSWRNSMLICSVPGMTSIGVNDGQAYGYIEDTDRGLIVNLNSPDRTVATRALGAHYFHSANGRLYDGGESGRIYRTLTDPEGRNHNINFHNRLSGLTSIPMPAWEKFARAGRKEE